MKKLTNTVLAGGVGFAILVGIVLVLVIRFTM